MDRTLSAARSSHPPPETGASDATVVPSRHSTHPSPPPNGAQTDVKASASEPPEEYHALFNDKDGDVVLKSNDGVRFRTYALVLRLSSSVLQDMLGHKQSLEGESQEDIVLVLDEEAAVIVNALIMVSGKAIPPDIVSPPMHFDRPVMFVLICSPSSAVWTL